jgi:hypothetical protein
MVRVSINISIHLWYNQEYCDVSAEGRNGLIKEGGRCYGTAL